MKRVAFLILLVAMIMPNAKQPVSAQDDENAHENAQAGSWCVSVWYPSSEHPAGLDSIINNLDVIHEVNPFWYTARADGTIDLFEGAEDADKLAAWRDAGLLIVPTIANASPFAIADEARDQNINAIIEIVERMDYDGIDIDYESFPLWTRDDFSLFIETLAERLHANGRMISVTVHAKTADQSPYEGAAAQDWARLAPAADVFKIMTYDYSNPNKREPGPIGPPLWSSDVLAYAATVTDLSKVRLGLHFYGYRWQRSDVASITWEGAQRAIESYNLTIERNPADMEAWFQLKVPGLPAQTYYVADAAGLEYKLGMILTNFPDLGGVAIWGLGGEDPANWDVLRDYQQSGCGL
jgi:spore germination protein